MVGSARVVPPTARSVEPARRAAAGRPPRARFGLHALQRVIGNRAVGRLLGEPAARDRPRSLPAALRAGMETALGADFTGVRVFEGEQSRRLGARAYTDGR